VPAADLASTARVASSDDGAGSEFQIFGGEPILVVAGHSAKIRILVSWGPVAPARSRHP
jgi:hypothetical protein